MDIQKDQILETRVRLELDAKDLRNYAKKATGYSFALEDIAEHLESTVELLKSIEKLKSQEEQDQYQIGQQVVYVDEFMPDTVEIITSIVDGWVSFNNGSRGCIAVMIRPANQDEIKANKRLMVA
ncbi:hypothetical protein BS636_10355 [Acinetobacter sp. LoGeW2-3]|uniref:hypothetical protein n=1 Tax=Acinetobacter sp. LoGeW2-3 TaxID=1808001 RepID=UPI000C05A4D7|nr:hypothetical protein [Acinetobacter sp. LoGeW2-3]ATO20028.1 hypothetical protein BS636_10355 [Acinetobacter sp. LoGeW2-3]